MSILSQYPQELIFHNPAIFHYSVLNPCLIIMNSACFYCIQFCGWPLPPMSCWLQNLQLIYLLKNPSSKYRHPISLLLLPNTCILLFPIELILLIIKPDLSHPLLFILLCIQLPKHKMCILALISATFWIPTLNHLPIPIDFTSKQGNRRSYVNK